jgi:hypothetical protein
MRLASRQYARTGLEPIAVARVRLVIKLSPFALLLPVPLFAAESRGPCRLPQGFAASSWNETFGQAFAAGIVCWPEGPAGALLRRMMPFR